MRLQRQIVNEDNAPQSDDSSNQLTSDDEENNSGDRGVKKVSPLINLPEFDMVNSFFVDGMHPLYLGIMKTFLLKWLNCPGEFYIGD